MQKIKIHGMVLDSGGEHQPAGAELTVSDDKKTGHITARRAEQLLAIHSATAVQTKKPAKAA